VFLASKPFNLDQSLQKLKELFCIFEKIIFMADVSLKLINETEPSTLAKIVMEIEPLNEKEKQVMLRQVRMRKALFIAEKLKGSVKPNKITLEQIVTEQKAMRKERKRHAAK
jgi:hypothetical protein